MLWEELTSLDVTSTNVVPTLKALLRSRDDLKVTYNLGGPEAQRVVEFINQVVDSPQLTEPLRKKTLQVLCKLCDSCQLLPAEYVLGDELVEAGTKLGSGGFADVWQGTYGGKPIAIKRLRVPGGGDFTKIYKRFCREVVIWKRLSHPNILPLLGVSTNGGDLRMISNLMTYGNVMAYLNARPSANRLLLLADVGKGLSYLHSLDLIHGDLKGANILVDDERVPRIADFGLMSIMKDTDTVLDTHTSVGGIGTPRWSAPELLDPPIFGFKSCQPSKQSDCHSLGMTIYEVLTGKVPFYDVGTGAVMMRIVRGIRPERPRLSHALGFLDSVWSIVEGCWKEDRSLRPDVSTVVKCLLAAASQWTPTPPLDDTPTTDPTETFSLVSDHYSSESAYESEPDEQKMEDETTVVPHYRNSAAENFRALSERFYDYYQKGYNLEHLDWAIKHEKAAALTYLPTHPGRLQCYLRLAGYHYERYEVSQVPQDIELSIEKSSNVERRATVDDPVRPDALLILAKAYHIHNYHDPHPENLELAIKHCKEAETLYPIGHPSRAETLATLSAALYNRYQASLNQADLSPPCNDLDDAISNIITAIELFPCGDQKLPYSRTQLSVFLFSRYQRQRGLSDLQQSIHHARLVLASATPEERPESLIYLGCLVTHLPPDPQNLADLAQCSREALNLLPPDDHRRPRAIYNLVVASHRTYVTLNSATHLDEAIYHNRQLLRLPQCDLEFRYSQLRLHCNLLEYRWNERQLDEDFVEMTSAAREAAMAESQSYYGHRYSTQLTTDPSSTCAPPPTERSPGYHPPRHWSPRPCYYDDSAISVVGSNSSSTGSGETGHCSSGSELSLVGRAQNLSFIEPDPDRYDTPFS